MQIWATPKGQTRASLLPFPASRAIPVAQISERFSALNPYSFGGTILKIEDVNYVDGDPRKPFRDLHGYAISAKRYCLFEGKNVRANSAWKRCKAIYIREGD